MIHRWHERIYDSKVQLYHGDCIEVLKQIPDGSVNLVLTDPPYNIGKAAWDKISNYVDWCEQWLTECVRVLADNGTLIFWHNDIPQMAQLIERIHQKLPLIYNSVGIWYKPSFRSLAWKNTDGGCTLRSWFNVCEYFLVYTNAKASRTTWDVTGLERINSDPESYKPLKEWYRSELERLGIGKPEIDAKYTEVTGKKPYMPDRHYFKDSQFEIPTKEVYDSVYIPLGFNKSYEELRQSYEELRQSYEELRQSYEELRPAFNIIDGEQYSNVFTSTEANSAVKGKQLHPCMKPLNILEKLIKTHSRNNAVVLDCFMGSGSTGVASVNTGRSFIGIDKEEKYFNIAKQRISDITPQLSLFSGGGMFAGTEGDKA